MRLAKTVTGVYVLDGDTVVAPGPFDVDDLPDALLTVHDLEDEYADAERVVLPLDRIAELGGVEVETVVQRQVAAATAYTEERLQEAEGRDQLMVQAVRALDDMDEANNELSERLRPWAGLHAPEEAAAEGSNEAFAAAVADDARQADADGTGMSLRDRDADILQRFAGHLSDGYALRAELEAYVEAVAEQVVPNLSAVLEPLLAARLVSEAGSLEKLARMPSSTVQVLGAEEAMFRHLEGEGSAPKHGVLFMHRYVRQAPEGSRGKMARVLANKASIAARLDQYGDDFRGDALRDEVAETFADLT